MLTERLRQLLQRESGLDLTRAVVESAMRRAMHEAGSTDMRSYATLLTQDRAALEALIEQVVVPETWFFRDADAFDAAVQVVHAQLAQLVRPTEPPQWKRPLRILSLPCASGEEPYSIAMALTDAGVAPAQFHIDGIDLSRRAIEAARRGIYSGNAFRGQGLSFRDRHFTSHDGSFELDPAIRRLVMLRQENLFSLPVPAPANRYDLVFCRNLLIYFDEATQGAAIRKLDALLQPDGVLFVGYAETAAFCRHGFTLTSYPKAFALRRATAPVASSRFPETRRRRPMRASRPVSARPAVAASQGTAPVATLDQARHLANAGQVDAACEQCRAYLATVPDSAEAWFMLGVLSEYRQQTAAAADSLRRAVYLDPDHYDALCHLALLFEQQGDGTGAEAFRRRAARVYQRRADKERQ